MIDRAGGDHGGDGKTAVAAAGGMGQTGFDGPGWNPYPAPSGESGDVQDCRLPGKQKIRPAGNEVPRGPATTLVWYCFWYWVFRPSGHRAALVAGSPSDGRSVCRVHPITKRASASPKGTPAIRLMQPGRKNGWLTMNDPFHLGPMKEPVSSHEMAKAVVG